MGRNRDAIGIAIAIAINRYSDWGYKLREASTPIKIIRGYRPREAGTLLVGDDLPRDNRYCDYGAPDRTGHDADESY